MIFNERTGGNSYSFLELNCKKGREKVKFSRRRRKDISFHLQFSGLPTSLVLGSAAQSMAANVYHCDYNFLLQFWLSLCTMCACDDHFTSWAEIGTNRITESHVAAIFYVKSHTILPTKSQMRSLAREILWKSFLISILAYPSISPSTAVFGWYRGCSCWYEPWLDISNDYFDSNHLFRTILGRCFNLKTVRARAAARRRRMKEVTAREMTRMLRSATLTLSKGTTSRDGGMFESWCSWHLSPYQPAGQKHSGAPSTILKIVLSHP